MKNEDVHMKERWRQKINSGLNGTIQIKSSVIWHYRGFFFCDKGKYKLKKLILWMCIFVV